MEEKSNSVWKSGLSYGLILGLILIISTVLLYVMDQNFNKVLSYINFIFVIAILVYGIKSFRDNNLNGYISYGKALGIGSIIAIVAGIISAIYFSIHITIIDTEYLTKYVAFMESELLKQGLPDDQIEMMLSMQSKMAKPLIMSAFNFFQIAFFGFIFALITSAILKKQADPYQEAMRDIEE